MIPPPPTPSPRVSVECGPGPAEDRTVPFDEELLRRLEPFGKPLEVIARKALPRRFQSKIDPESLVGGVIENLGRADSKPSISWTDQRLFGYCKVSVLNALKSEIRRYKAEGRDVDRERVSLNFSSARLGEVLAASQTTPSAAAQRKEAAVEVERARKSLSQDHDTLIHLYIDLGLSVADIARSLHRPPSTVQSQIQRAIEILSTRLKHLG
ncbi:MAG: RNA polymerase sigma factor [Isosphaerales bacterium]